MTRTNPLRTVVFNEWATWTEWIEGTVVSVFDEVTRAEFDDTAGARRNNLNAKEGYLVPYLEATTIEELIMFLFVFGRCSLYYFASMNAQMGQGLRANFVVLGHICEEQIRFAQAYSIF